MQLIRRRYNIGQKAQNDKGEGEGISNEETSREAGKIGSHAPRSEIKAYMLRFLRFVTVERKVTGIFSAATALDLKCAQIKDLAPFLIIEAFYQTVYLSVYFVRILVISTKFYYCINNT